jgi:hypothetical protein
MADIAYWPRKQGNAFRCSYFERMPEEDSVNPHVLPFATQKKATSIACDRLESLL